MPLIAQFIVHVRAPGVVALRNVKDPNLWIKATADNITPGSGGRKCEFRVLEVGGLGKLIIDLVQRQCWAFDCCSLHFTEDHLVFESMVNPDWHIGINHNGSIRTPKDTGKGMHAWFTPKVKQLSPWLPPSCH